MMINFTKGFISTILLTVLAINIANAQNANQYSFAANSGTFTSILGQTGSVPIPTIHGDDQTSTGLIPFGFTFNYCGVNYTGFRVCSNGWVSFTNPISTTTSSNGTTDLQIIKPALMPLWDDLSGASNFNATGLFQTSGTAPNRVFTFECNNWAWNNSASSAVISFQIKLYETSNEIEFIYRPESGSVNTPADATIGICDGNVPATFLTLDNASASPTASSTTFTTTIGTRPANGQVYRFTPPPPCAGAPPVALISPSGPISICTGAIIALTGTLAPAATGVTYQWEESTTGAAPWQPIAGATTANGSFTPSTPTIYYRLVTTCTASGQTTTSAAVQINTAPPIYTSVPYFQGFETWTNYCDNKDVPAGITTNWQGTPATTDSAWRRDDEGNTANWSTQWGAYFPASYEGNHSARFSSTSVSNTSFTGDISGHLDLYLDCSGQTGDKEAYFYFINPSFGWESYDSLRISVSTNGGATFNHVAVFDSADNWKQVSVPISSNTAQTILRFSGYVSPFLDFSDLGIDSLYIAAPCTGASNAGLIPAVTSMCPGKPFVLSPNGVSMAGNLTFQWQESLNGGTTWTDVAGATSKTFTTPSLYDTVSYRMVVTCAGSLLTDTTNEIVLEIATPLYATVPFLESFENWVDNCDTVDAPSFNWVNAPSTGDQSWRREDQGSTTWNFVFGDYTPASKHLSHSARFHSSAQTNTGNLDLFIDCSGAGTKELQFYYINPTSFSDSLRIFLSINNGASFTQLAAFPDALNWTFTQIPINSTSAQTVIRFQGQGDWGMDDLGIDLVQVVPPCSGAPVAGTVDSVKVCSGQNFDLSLTGTSASGGLIYTWQESPDNINWTNIVNGNTAIVTTSTTTPTYYRAIVTCSNSGLSDTSNSQFLDIAPFYLCYCPNKADNGFGEDVGNVTINRINPTQQVLNNGIASPLTSNATSVNTYTDFTGVPAANIYKGESYNYSITVITDDVVLFNNAAVSIYIDMDRDGVYDPFTERVLQGNANFATQIFNNNFTIPTTAQSGITGMRVILNSGFGFTDPCYQMFNIPFGEVEDYLINIDYPICTGPLNAGVTEISDTVLCENEPFIVFDTSHEKLQSSTTWIWQSSPDNATWTDMVGTDDMDTLFLSAPNASVYYRLKMICIATSDETYSSEVFLRVTPAYFCYCKSYADGGSNDLSDNGAFAIGSFIVNGGGPHLSNLAAIQSRTVNDNLVTLYRDSTYQVSAYHIIKDANHQDAKVTLFIDYDNNFVYDIPIERVWTSSSSSSNAFMNTSITIPNTAVKNMKTGMRLVINNDTNPNTPSDEACGTYTSGETEDYVVMIRDKNDPPPTGVEEMGKKLNVWIYPNPTDGLFTLKIPTLNAHKLSIIVSNLLGQEVFKREYKTEAGKEFEKQIDINGVLSGVYIIEIKTDKERISRKLIRK